MLYPEMDRSSWRPTIIYASLFLLLALLVTTGVLVSFDRHMALVFPDVFASKLLLFPFSRWVSLFIFLVLLILIYKKVSLRIAWRFFLSILLAASLELAFKLFLDQPAGVKDHSFLWINLENAFPSGHVTRATLMAGGIYLLTGLRAIWLLPLLPALSMLSFGYHWATDLIGGFFLSLFVLYLLQVLPRSDALLST